jgi:hypothetical protein
MLIYQCTLTEDEEFILGGVGLPCVGKKAGGGLREREGRWEESRRALIINELCRLSTLVKNLRRKVGGKLSD